MEENNLQEQYALLEKEKNEDRKKTIIIIILCILIILVTLLGLYFAYSSTGNGCTLNCDTNNDNIPDLNIDINGDGTCNLNCDTNGDGKPDTNIDSDNTGKCDTNCNINADGDSSVDINTDNNLVLYVSYLNSISVSGISPNWKGNQQFTVNNYSDQTLSFNIKLTNVKNTFNPTSDFVYSLRRDGVLIKYHEVAPVSDTIILEKVMIPGHMTYKYDLEYEFLETGVNQNYNQGKTFGAKIEVEAAD